MHNLTSAIDREFEAEFKPRAVPDPIRKHAAQAQLSLQSLRST
jgi:hypothetical protein